MMKYYKNDTTGVIYAFAAEHTRPLTDIEVHLLTQPQQNIEVTRNVKLSEIRTECETNINAGFISNALGYDVHYRCNRDDQGMIRDAKTNGGGLLWLNDSLAVHTSDQISKVFADMVNHRDIVCKSTYVTKVKYVTDSIRTIGEIDAVTWDSVE